jgi:hypothetical protein
MDCCCKYTKRKGQAQIPAKAGEFGAQLAVSLCIWCLISSIREGTRLSLDVCFFADNKRTSEMALDSSNPNSADARTGKVKEEEEAP